VRAQEFNPFTGDRLSKITPYTIYTRAGKGWRKVTRSAAVLDGEAFAEERAS